MTAHCTHRDPEFIAHFRQGKTVAEVAEAMGVTIYQSVRARRRLHIPTKGVVGRRGGARGRAQIERVR